MVRSGGRAGLLTFPHGGRWTLGFNKACGGPADNVAGSLEDPRLEIIGADGVPETVGVAHYLVATGSLPWVPPVEGLAGTDYLTSATAMKLEEVPDSLLVLGGG